MLMHASWVHGNAVRVQNVENVVSVSFLAPGAEIVIAPGRGCWFHVPLPTPAIVAEHSQLEPGPGSEPRTVPVLESARTSLHRVSLLFGAGEGTLRNVHVHDGSAKVQEWNDLHVRGDHRLATDGQNSFTLATPHRVTCGIGLSFFFVADVGIDTASKSPAATLVVCAAGADFGS